jgi:cytochrome c biogenesis protein CcdA
MQLARNLFRSTRDGASGEGTNLRTLTVSAVVAAAALAVAIAGALAVGSGGGIDSINLFVQGTLSGNSKQLLGGLISAASLYALAAGMVSAVNPCGFAMLPAYLGLYMGSNLTGDNAVGPVRSILRAVVVGAAVSAGFILLFGIVGAVAGVSVSFVGQVLPWLGLAIGGALVAAGAWMVSGGKLYTSLAARAAGRLGNPNQVNVKSYFMFGLSYGTASLSCTLPIFLGVVGIGVTGAAVQKVVGNFFLFAIGMGLVIMAMTLGMAIFKGTVVTVMRKALPYIQPVAAGFMLLAGAYIVFYWLTVGRSLL